MSALRKYTLKIYFNIIELKNLLHGVNKENALNY